jgi:hypothetical protein
MRKFAMTISIRSCALLTSFLAVQACGGGSKEPAKTSADGTTPSSASTASASGGDPKGGITWTPFDDAQAGIHAELPCASPTSAIKSATDGPMQYTNKALTCVVGSSRYTLEYWTTMSMTTTDVAGMKALIEPVFMAWFEAPKNDGYTVTDKNPIKSVPGWTAFEVRSTKGSESRSDRHFLLLPRHIMMRAVGPTDDSSDHDRFNGSLKIGEVGSVVGEAKEGMAERPIDLGGAHFSVTLPCAPTFKPDEVDQTPDGPMKTREFECRHPSANQGFMGSVGRYDRPATGSPQSRRAKNMQLADANAKQFCFGITKEVPGAKCRVVGTNSYGASGAEAIAESDGMYTRILVDYPYMGMIAVIAEIPVAERTRLLSGLKMPTP